MSIGAQQKLFQIQYQHPEILHKTVKSMHKKLLQHHRKILKNIHISWSHAHPAACSRSLKYARSDHLCGRIHWYIFCSRHCLVKRVVVQELPPRSTAAQQLLVPFERTETFELWSHRGANKRWAAVSYRWCTVPPWPWWCPHLSG